MRICLYGGRLSVDEWKPHRKKMNIKMIKWFIICMHGFMRQPEEKKMMWGKFILDFEKNWIAGYMVHDMKKKKTRGKMRPTRVLFQNGEILSLDLFYVQFLFCNLVAFLLSLYTFVKQVICKIDCFFSDGFAVFHRFEHKAEKLQKLSRGRSLKPNRWVFDWWICKIKSIS